MNSAAEKLRIRLAGAVPERAQTHARIPLGHDGADACLKGGLRRDALHEVFAQTGHEAAATGFAAALARRVCGGKHLLWIRQDFSALEFGELAATGLLELGIDPGQVLLLHVSDVKGALHAAGDALSCAALGAVVIEIPGNPKILDLTASRRLTLACAQNGVAAVLLRLSARPEASAAETRWLIRGSPSAEEEDWGKPVVEAHLVRNRSGLVGSWGMEWDCDDDVFRAARAGAVVSTLGDRQDSAGAALVA